MPRLTNQNQLFQTNMFQDMILQPDKRQVCRLLFLAAEKPVILRG